MTIEYKDSKRIVALEADVAAINRGTITTDGSYTVIKFTENGKFTPTSSFNVEYLVVGGGGAGGAGAHNSGAGAGGGAGGYRTATGHAVTAQDYNIIVGKGGTGRSTYGQGEDGGDSTFDNITSIGGGGGGYLTAGGTGGSGGGSGNNGTAGASGTAGQGNSGGAGEYRSGGGGGGAGSAGSASSGSTGGAGGSGTVSSITGSNVTYSAGGGGAGDNTGGTGGSNNTGGQGVPNGTAAAGNGVVNTGSGGGGTYVTTSHPSGSGADGVVILRFLTSGNTYETSLEGKPTNVQDNSLLVEKDTGYRYWFDETTTKWINPYGDYIFKFNTDQTDNAAQTHVYVDTANSWWYGYSGTNASADTGQYINLGSELSDDWTMAFKVITNQDGNTNSLNAIVGFYLSNSTGVSWTTTAHDFVNVWFNTDSSSRRNIRHSYGVNQTGSGTGSIYLVDNTGTYGGDTLPDATDITLYVVVNKNGTTTTAKLYTDSALQNQYGVTGTNTSVTSSNLQYLKLISRSASGTDNQAIVKIQSVQIKDGDGNWTPKWIEG